MSHLHNLLVTSDKLEIHTYVHKPFVLHINMQTWPVRALTDPRTTEVRKIKTCI